MQFTKGVWNLLNHRHQNTHHMISETNLWLLQYSVCSRTHTHKSSSNPTRGSPILAKLRWKTRCRWKIIPHSQTNPWHRMSSHKKQDLYTISEGIRQGSDLFDFWSVAEWTETVSLPQKFGVWYDSVGSFVPSFAHRSDSRKKKKKSLLFENLKYSI